MKIIFSCILLCISYIGFAQEDGEIIFKNNCAACHSYNKDLVGPSLGNINLRLTTEEFYLYTAHSDSSIFKNNSYFRRLKKQYNNSNHIKFVDLTDKEVALIYNYITNYTPVVSGATINIDNKEKNESPYLGSINIGLANLRFTIDTIIYVDSVQNEANLIISSSYALLNQELNKIIDETYPDKIISENIKLKTKYIDATLVDGSPSKGSPIFEIKEIGEVPVRELNDSSLLEWKWKVKGLKANIKSDLFLTIRFYTKKGVTTDDDFNDRRNLTYTIKVIANEISFYKKTTNFFKEEWKSLCSLFFIPIFIYFFNSYKNGKRTKKKI